MTHPKITKLPIGLDYHTMANQNEWGKSSAPMEQEKILLDIKANSSAFWERQPKCYANFHFLTTTKHGYDRLAAINQVPKELVHYEPSRIPRLDTWNAQKDYAFVISPHGNGLDCHRTWEALTMGCVPIVKSSKIDILYADLPVLIVNEWHEVTTKLLQTTMENFQRRIFNLDKLSLQYWTDKMRKPSMPPNRS